jgi:hypothetical protein
MIDPSSGNAGFALSDEEHMLALKALSQGNILEQRYAPRPDKQDPLNRITRYTGMGPVDIVRMFPLKADGEVFGVLCLRVTNPVPWFASATQMQEKGMRSDARTAFFWTFLEQATSILERARLRLEVLPGSK